MPQSLRGGGVAGTAAGPLDDRRPAADNEAGTDVGVDDLVVLLTAAPDDDQRLPIYLAVVLAGLRA